MHKAVAREENCVRHLFDRPLLKSWALLSPLTLWCVSAGIFSPSNLPYASWLIWEWQSQRRLSECHFNCQIKCRRILRKMMIPCIRKSLALAGNAMFNFVGIEKQCGIILQSWLLLSFLSCPLRVSRSWLLRFSARALLEMFLIRTATAWTTAVRC